MRSVTHFYHKAGVSDPALGDYPSQPLGNNSGKMVQRAVTKIQSGGSRTSMGAMEMRKMCLKGPLKGDIAG